MAIKLKKKDYSKCVEFVNSAYKSSLEFQRPYFERFNDYYRMYRAIREDNKQNYAGRARLYIPYVFATIETIIPRLVGAKPKIEAVPREPGDIEKAKNNNSVFNYEWDEMEMKSKLKLWVKQMLIYGTGVIKLTWLFKGDETAVQIDRPNAELVDLFDFFIDPNATSTDDAAFIIQRAERDLEELRNNTNYTVPKELVSQVTDDQYKIQRDSVLGLVKPKDASQKKIQVLEYWGKYDLGDGEEECLIVVANSSLLRAEPNPYQHKQKPFIAVSDTQVPHSFWAIGEVEQLESLQYELNDIRNQRMDNVTLILSRMWKVDKNAGVDEGDLISQAGQIVHVDDMNGVEPLTTPDVTQSAYNEESLVKGDMQLVSGVSDYTRGSSESGKGQGGSLNQTATGIALLQEAGNARFKYKLDNIEDALVAFGKQLLALNQQFMDTARTLRIIGQGRAQWIEMQPDDIIGEFDVTVEAGSTQPMNKSVRRAEARELVQTLIPLAQLGIDLKPIIKNLLQTYDLQNIDEVFQQQLGVPGQAPGLDPQNLMGVQGKNPGTAAQQGFPTPANANQAPGIVANANNG